MKRLSFLVLFSGMQSLLWAQPVQRWMKLYDELDRTELVGGVCQLPDSTYRICCSWSSSTLGHLTPTGITQLGDTLWRKHTVVSGNEIESGVSRTLQLRSDGNVVWAGGVYPNGTSDLDPALFCFSAAGDSLWFRTYPSPAYECFNGMCLLPDGGACMVGLSSAIQSDILVTRVDINGDILWSYTYGNNSDENAFSVVNTQDGGFAIGAFRWLSNNNVATVLLKIDTMGNELWLRTYGTPYLDNGCAVTELADGSFVLATAFGIAPVPNTSKRATLIKTDAVGVEQWTATLQDTFYSAYTTAPLNMESGAYVMAGARLPGGDPIGMLTKLDLTGNPLWERNYLTNAGLSHYIYDLRRTLDGGFIMAGTAFDTVPPLSQDAWLIKTDSFGCLVPGCQVFDAVLEQYTDLTGSLTLSPNPTSDLLQVGIELPPGLVTTGALRLTLVDAQGRKVLEQQVARSPSLTFSLGSFPAGIYFLHLTSDRKWLAGAKVVVD